MADDRIQARLESLMNDSVGGLANPAADASSEVKPAFTSDGENGEQTLLCAMCRQPYSPDQLTVVSNERWNYESAVVVCPTDLERMLDEQEERIGGADLLMASVWGLILFLIVTTAIGALIWFNRAETFEPLWGYIGSYLLVVVGFVIGKAVYYGSGRKDSLTQRLIAVGFTALALLITCYINQISLLNLVLDISKPDGHAFAYMDPINFITGQIFQPIFDLLQNHLWIGIAVLAGSFVGLVVAYFSSGAAGLYTRPFLNSRK